MARIQPQPRPGWFARLAYWICKRRFGKVPEPLEVMAHHPTLMFGYAMQESSVERAHRLSPALKDLAALKAASLIGCAFCLDIASYLARNSGAREMQLRELTFHRDSEHFSELEKLVLDYAEAMTRTPAIIPEEMFASLRTHFDEAQLVELTLNIALENQRARFNHAFGIGSQNFSEGQFCAIPQSVPA